MIKGSILIILLVIITSFISYSLARVFRLYAIKKQYLDIPNIRSSHKIPIPRIGGLAIVVTFYVSLFGLFVLGKLSFLTVLVFCGSGIPVAAIGFADDLGHISPRWRILVHFFAALWGVISLADTSNIFILDYMKDIAWLFYIFISITIVWILNLFNFMDGIDGIAASEAVFIMGSMLLFTYPSGSSAQIFVSIILIGSVLGFLLINWPPAKIFMGDVGSGFLGITLGIYAYWSMIEGDTVVWTWLIVFAVFICDASITLIRRILQKAKWYEAHRSHAYQHAAKKWGHLRVTFAVNIINFFWLLPIAYLSHIKVVWGAELMALAYVPLVVLVLLLGAGKEMKL